MVSPTASAVLVLADGTIFQGQGVGAVGTAVGEVCFNTSITGYQEILTDPSYAGQIVVPTYPLIGNYGINDRDFESRKVQVAGFVVREHSLRPSHATSTSSTTWSSEYPFNIASRAVRSVEPPLI